MMCSRRPRQRRSYTTIELAVVMSTLMVIMAMVLPMFTNARKHAQDVRAQSTLVGANQIARLAYVEFDGFVDSGLLVPRLGVQYPGVDFTSASASLSRPGQVWLRSSADGRRLSMCSYSGTERVYCALTAPEDRFGGANPNPTGSTHPALGANVAFSWGDDLDTAVCHLARESSLGGIACDDQGGPSLSRTPISSARIDTPFLHDGTMAVIEAEDASASTARGGMEWFFRLTRDDYSGAGSVLVPNVAAGHRSTGDPAGAPQLDYPVYFTRAGAHYVWVRMRPVSGNDDSVHIGLDGVVPASNQNITGLAASNSYGWRGTNASAERVVVDVPAPGLHTLNLLMREDGTEIDRLIITTDAAYAPAATGPAQTPRMSSDADYRERVLGLSPVAYWPMDETAGVSLADASGNGHTLDFTAGRASLGQVPVRPSSQSPSVAYADGAAIASRRNSAMDMPATGITMEAWVELDALPAKGNVVNVGNSLDGYALGVGDGACTCTPGTRLMGLYDMRRWIDSGWEFPGPGRYHIAMRVDDAGTAVFFVNGIQVSTRPGLAPLTPTSMVIVGGSGTRGFIGRIGDVAVYDRALSDREMSLATR